MSNTGEVNMASQAMQSLKGGVKNAYGALPGGFGAKMNVGMTAFDFYGNIQSGDDIGTAAVKAGANYMLWSALPGPMTALTIAPAAGKGIAAFNGFVHRKQQWWNQQYNPMAEVGGRYVDTQRAQTMRQAAVQAIQGSKLNARSALGGEAQILANNPYNSR